MYIDLQWLVTFQFKINRTVYTESAFTIHLNIYKNNNGT